ncbi:MAG: hypothetical protein ACLGIS_18280 [Actinomycetes bacterium]
MTPSTPVLRVASTTASAAVLAIALCFLPGGTAGADSTEPTPASTTSPDQCLLLFCEPGTAADPKPGEPTRTQKPKEPESPPAPPADPVPAPPQQPAPPVAPPAGTAPVPAATPAETEEPAAEPTTSAATETAVSPPPTGPSNGHDWNAPVTRSATATRVAAVASAGDSGDGGPTLLPIIAGTLLLGAAGASFAWWGRNRFRTH